LTALVGLCLLAPRAAPAQPSKPPQPTVAILSADASTVAAQTDDEIRVWQRGSGKLLAQVKNLGSFRGSLAPGALVAVSDEGITVWRSKRYNRAVRLRVPKVLSMGRTSISADGKVATAIFAHDGGVGDPDTVGVWDAESGAMRGRITLRGARVLGAALSADGKLIAVFGDRGGSINARGRRHTPAAVLRVHSLTSKSVGPALLRWSSIADRTTYCAAFAPGPRPLLGLCAGKRLVLWELAGVRARLVTHAGTDAIKSLFPKQLQGPSVELPGAHGLVFSPDGKQLLTFHAYGVIGIARWSAQPTRRAGLSLRPIAWIKRPLVGGTMRQVAWDSKGEIWLVTSGYSSKIQIHTPRRDRFAPVRVLGP